jgi:hypothetical protein
MNTEIAQISIYKSVIRTKSPIKAWYLIHFCGQKVRSTRVTPVVTFLGVILYSKAWILVG